MVDANDDKTKWIDLTGYAGSICAVKPLTGIHLYASNAEVIRLEAGGDIYWRGRKVEGDDDFRAAMVDLSVSLKAMR